MHSKSEHWRIINDVNEHMGGASAWIAIYSSIRPYLFIFDAYFLLWYSTGWEESNDDNKRLAETGESLNIELY